MRAEREKLNAKITAGALKLAGGRLELPAEMCHIVLFSGGSCTVQCGDTSLLVSPGCVLLLGPGVWAVSQAGHTQPEMLGCSFPQAALHEMKNATGEDFLRLFAPGSQMALYGSIQWQYKERPAPARPRSTSLSAPKAKSAYRAYNNELFFATFTLLLLRYFSRYVNGKHR